MPVPDGLMFRASSDGSSGARVLGLLCLSVWPSAGAALLPHVRHLRAARAVGLLRIVSPARNRCTATRDKGS